MPNPPRSYSETEVQAILARAIERAESGKSKLSLDDLVAVGAELGVSRTAIEHAAAEVSEVADPAPKTPAGGALKTMQVRARAAWFRHFFVYAAVNAFLLFVNLMTNPDYLWFLWPLAGWGLGVVLSARRAFFMGEDEAQHLVEHHERKRTRKEAKEAKKDRRKNRRSRTGPVDDVQLRTRIDARVDAVLAERGMRVDASPAPEQNEQDELLEREEREEEARVQAKSPRL